MKHLAIVLVLLPTVCAAAGELLVSEKAKFLFLIHIFFWIH